jgi:hypothetical protein
MSRSRIVVVTFLCDRQSDYGCLAVGKPGEEGLRVLRPDQDIQKAADNAGLLAVRSVFHRCIQIILRHEPIALLGSLQARANNAPIAAAIDEHVLRE